MTIGRALPTFSSYILKDGKPAEVGELFIGGRSIARGYLNLPEANKKFQRLDEFGRVFTTGDMVEYIEGTRNMKFCGRADRQIKINGYRLELDEVEVAIRKLDIVKEAVVVFKESILIAFIQPVPSAGCDLFLPTVLKPQLQKFGLPYYAVPSQIRVIKEFPRTVTGKLDNTNLFNVPVMNQSLNEDAEPLNATESIVARIFEDLLVLPINSCKRNDNFFEIGGDSGKAGIIVSRLRQNIDPKFGTIAVHNLYSAPTVGGLASVIDKNSDSNSSNKEELLKKLAPPIGTPRPRLVAFIQLLVSLVLMIIDGLHIYLVRITLYNYNSQSFNYKM